MRALSLVAAALLSACASRMSDPAPPSTHSAFVPSDTLTRLATAAWISPEGTRLRFAMLVPPLTPGQRLPFVLALHGQAPGRAVPPYFGQRNIEQLFGPALRPLGALIVAPDAPTNNWTNPVDERALLSLVDELLRRYPIDTMRTLLTGISMGGMGSWYLGGKYPKRFRAIVPLTSFPLIRQTPINRQGLSAAGDEMVRDSSWAAAYRDVPVYAIHSRHDESVPFSAESTLVSIIRSRGGKPEFIAVDSLKHNPASLYQPALRAAVPWIQQQWNRR